PITTFLTPSNFKSDDVVKLFHPKFNSIHQVGGTLYPKKSDRMIHLISGSHSLKSLRSSPKSYTQVEIFLSLSTLS
ncbi:hypothetical protein, partial [Candidatus Cardinium sp. cBcalN1]|uniref:hypothetical protein n=1 Tax=Candidatus Cardinium sp. cBcalN1 TaxID=2699437 RepID=UPI001FB40F44